MSYLCADVQALSGTSMLCRVQGMKTSQSVVQVLVLVRLRSSAAFAISAWSAASIGQISAFVPMCSGRWEFGRLLTGVASGLSPSLMKAHTGRRLHGSDRECSDPAAFLIPCQRQSRDTVPAWQHCSGTD